jgi:Tfp pilus assembly protein PilX
MSTKHMSPKQLLRSELGMVSIMTTMVLIIVISLIVLGFAQLSRRNQRQALDRQLSTQAFYAAESGVNDVREILNDAVAAGQVIPEKTTCTGTAGGFYNLATDIDTAANIKYSCVLVDATPTVLRYNNVSTTSIIVPVISADSSPINSIQMDWQSKITGNPISGCGNTIATIPDTASWTCGYGMLRFDLVPTNGNFNTTDLLNRNMTSFVYPLTSGGDADGRIAYAAGNSNPQTKVGVNCTSTGCRLTVTGGLGQNSYHMRITSQYRNAALQVRALNGSGTAMEIRGAQALIDATGRAQDVLRRVQVSVPINGSSENQVGDYAVQTTDSICKRFSVMDNYYDNDVTGVTSTNRMCAP